MPVVLRISVPKCFGSCWGSLASSASIWRALLPSFLLANSCMSTGLILASLFPADCSAPALSVRPWLYHLRCSVPVFTLPSLRSTVIANLCFFSFLLDYNIFDRLFFVFFFFAVSTFQPYHRASLNLCLTNKSLFFMNSPSVDIIWSYQWRVQAIIYRHALSTVYCARTVGSGRNISIAECMLATNMHCSVSLNST